MNTAGEYIVSRKTMLEIWDGLEGLRECEANSPTIEEAAIYNELSTMIVSVLKMLHLPTEPEEAPHKEADLSRLIDQTTDEAIEEMRGVYHV